MMTILLPVNTAITVTFMLMKHPLSMGMMLMMQTIAISLITSNLNQSPWFSYILFLIMVGGMLILFMYMTSVASNEKFKTNPKMTLIALLIPPLMFMLNKMTLFTQKPSETLPATQAEEMALLLNKFINSPMSLTLIFLMMYLLLALIATVKISNFKQGSIRQMN
uniref:NADH-ubiquinone oxidoreductase chain 6 n=1 Tax=Promethis valgipes TaxID=1304790 RepID=A0A7T0Q4T0_9CUCU|nr:NADH dehydrogenase subunit 6 [Promethis valgipes]QPL15577.1 NADH dehydrogenase subunit 6 [Promethis valgipes]